MIIVVDYSPENSYKHCDYTLHMTMACHMGYPPIGRSMRLTTHSHSHMP